MSCSCLEHYSISFNIPGIPKNSKKKKKKPIYVTYFFNVDVLEFGMPRNEHGMDSWLRSRVFCFAFSPTLMLTSGENLSSSANKPWALWKMQPAVFYEGLNLFTLLILVNCCKRNQIIWIAHPLSSQWRAIQAKLDTNQKDQYNAFCKDFECFVIILVQVLYFVAFLVPGPLVPYFFYV